MYQPTHVTPRNVRSQKELVRRDFEEVNIWLILFSTAALVLVFAGIVYRWRVKSKTKNRTRQGLDI